MRGGESREEMRKGMEVNQRKLRKKESNMKWESGGGCRESKLAKVDAGSLVVGCNM